MNAYLLLADGTVFTGQAAGSFKETISEIVFNTAMTGYVEMLTDPANAGLGVVMTYPLIGNYGVCVQDMESHKLYPSVLLVHELCETPSNFRCELTLEEWLCEHGVPCVKGLDTRAITMHLRTHGVMKGAVTADLSKKDALLEAMRQDAPVDCPKEEAKKVISENGTPIAFVDLGAKKSAVQSFAQHGFAVTKFPKSVTAAEILSEHFAGVVFSNGPEQFDAFADTQEEMKKLIAAGIPIFGIGLGHLLLARAQGGEIAKMKQGHRGCNFPVRFTEQDRTYISTHNHGYTVSKAPQNAQVLCVNVNDRSIEGLRYTDKPILSVQFTPDSAKGPNTSFLFDAFAQCIKEGK